MSREGVGVPIVEAVLADPVVTAAIDHTSAAAAPVVSASGSLVAPPKTTEEEDRKSLGQREINLIWETTQMKVALSVIWAALAVGAVLAVFSTWLGTPDVQLAAVVFLFGVANLVTGFYFGRTNHQRSGGVGGDAAGAR